MKGMVLFCAKLRVAKRSDTPVESSATEFRSWYSVGMTHFANYNELPRP